MNARTLRSVEKRLGQFVREVTAPMGRSERRHWATLYTRGLLLDGERKSIEPLAQRVGGGDVQAMQQFIGQSPWAAERVQELLDRRMEEGLSAPRYWIVDETSFPKQGKHSVGVARQYCGSLGKIANCQVAVSLHWSSEEAGFPLGWRLYLPDGWVTDGERRRKAGIPEAIGYRSKPELALDLMDQALGWGLTPGIILGDSLYGDSFQWREALRQRQLSYCVQAEGTTAVWRKMPQTPVGAYVGRGRPRKHPRLDKIPAPVSLMTLARRLPAKRWHGLAWREGTRGMQSSRFAMVPVWAAHGWRKRIPRTRVKEIALIEWPEGAPAPTRFWLSNMTQAGLRVLVRTAKGRWRIELDYRQLKEELGLDHFEGRSWLGWHHHITMVTLAYAFLCLEQARSKKNAWCDFTPGATAAPAVADSHGRTLPVVSHDIL